jgi:hypothetical protein
MLMGLMFSKITSESKYHIRELGRNGISKKIHHVASEKNPFFSSA